MRTVLFTIFSLCSVAAGVQAQAVPTASQALQISVFGLGTGTYTGLNGGRNLGITAGANVEVRPRHSIYPSLEARGTYPIYGGQVDRQKNILGGLKLSKHYGSLHPYADILVGRGQISYENGGLPNPAGTYQYLHSPSTVVSPGLGIDYAVGEHIQLKADLQIQHYSTPVTASGSLFAKPLSVGVIYRLNSARLGRR